MTGKRARGAVVFLGVLITTAAWAVQIPPVDADWIADEGNLLQPADRAEIAQLISRERQRSGVQLAVLTLLDGLGEQPKSIAVRALNQWNPGPNSVLLLVEMNPRELYIQPGTRLAGQFDETVAKNICRSEIGPRLRAGRYRDGIQAGLTRIGERLRNPGVPPTPGRSDALANGLMLLVCMLVPLGLLAIPAVLIFVVVQANRRRCPSCRALMRKVGAPSGVPRVQLWQCPRCGYQMTAAAPVRVTLGNTPSSDFDSSFGSSDFGGGGGGGGSSDGSGGGGSSW